MCAVAKAEGPALAEAAVPGLAETERPAAAEAAVPGLVEAELPAAAEAAVPGLVEAELPAAAQSDYRHEENTQEITKSSFVIPDLGRHRCCTQVWKCIGFLRPCFGKELKAGSQGNE